MKTKKVKKRLGSYVLLGMFILAMIVFIPVSAFAEGVDDDYKVAVQSEASSANNVNSTSAGNDQAASEISPSAEPPPLESEAPASGNAVTPESRTPAASASAALPTGEDTEPVPQNDLLDPEKICQTGNVAADSALEGNGGDSLAAGAAVAGAEDAVDLPGENTAAGEGNSYTAEITSERVVASGTDTAFTVVFTETGHTTKLGSVQLSLPAGFSNLNLAADAIRAAGEKTWLGNVVDLVLTLWAQDEASYLGAGESVTAAFSATTPTETGIHTFETKAWSDNAAQDRFNGASEVVNKNNMAEGYVDPTVGVLHNSNPFHVGTAAELDAVRLRLGASYLQIADIDLSGFSNWEPIGPFTGAFDGNGFKILNLTINRPVESYVGLFGKTAFALIENITLTDAYVVGGPFTGALVGYSDSSSSISNVTVSGVVRGEGNRGLYVGGLVGWSDGGAIYNSSSYATVTGYNYVGGLVGLSVRKAIYNSSSYATVTGGNVVGGLVGYLYDGTIANSYSHATVTGTVNVGGLAGHLNVCDIYDSYSHASVTGHSNVGGLVGYSLGGAIYNSSSYGAVTGYSHVGGLVGHLWRGAIAISYSRATVYGSFSVGGLVGYSVGGTIANSFSHATVTAYSCFSYAGGLVGYSVGGTITDSYSYATVTGYSSVGGLVGALWEGGAIADSYSYATVAGDGYVGGLVGLLEGGTIEGSHSRATVTGTSSVGGLVGLSWGGAIADNYSYATVTGYSGVGGLVGYLWGAAITDSYSHATVTGTSSVGGLVGYSWGGAIADSYSYATVTGYSNVGGLVGDSVGGTIGNSFSYATVTGYSSVGGLVGYSSGGAIYDSYSHATVTGYSSVGGLVGTLGCEVFGIEGNIHRSYSAGLVSGTDVNTTGGLVGKLDHGTVEHSYWDIQASGQATSAAGIGKTTAEMLSGYPSADIYTGWSTAVWVFAPSVRYPQLLSNLEPDPFPTPVPNDKPIISHVPVQVARAGQDVTISAHVIDATGVVDWVELRYRRGNDVLYCIAPMYHDGNDNYSALIPGEMVNTTGIHYYITAEDNQGLKAYDGTAENYHKIDVGTHIVVYIPVKHKNDPAAIRTVDELRVRAQLVERYFKEQSYGAVKILSVFASDEWVELSAADLNAIQIPPHISHYGETFLEDYRVVRAAISKSNINLDNYDAVVVVRSDKDHGDRINYGDYAYGTIVHTSDSASFSIWAHELGHAVFNWYDYYQSPGYLYTRGDTGYWCLMGLGVLMRPPAPISAYLKALDHVNWLNFEQLNVGDHVPIDNLMDLEYGDSVYRFETGNNRVSAFIFEGRHPPDEMMGFNDPWSVRCIEYLLIKERGIMMYQVELIDAEEYLFNLGKEKFVLDYPFFARFGVTLPIGEEYFADPYNVKFAAYMEGSQLMLKAEEHTPKNRTLWQSFLDFLDMLIAPLRDIPIIIGNDESDLDGGSYFDINLQVYTSDGLKVGVDNKTGEYLMQIPDARGSGDVPGGGSEWISVPNTFKTYYVIDTTEAVQWMKAFGITELSMEVVVERIEFDSEGGRTVTSELVPILLTLDTADPSDNDLGIRIRMPDLDSPIYVLIVPEYIFDKTDEAGLLVSQIWNLLEPYISSSFIMYGTPASLQQAVNAYEEALLLYQGNSHIFSETEKGLIETLLALVFAAIEAVEFNLQLAEGINVDSGRAIEAYDYARSMFTKNSIYMTDEQINNAIELLQSINDIILDLMFENAA